MERVTDRATWAATDAADAIAYAVEMSRAHPTLRAHAAYACASVVVPRERWAVHAALGVAAAWCRGASELAAFDRAREVAEAYARGDGYAESAVRAALATHAHPALPWLGDVVGYVGHGVAATVRRTAERDNKAWARMYAVAYREASRRMAATLRAVVPYDALAG